MQGVGHAGVLLVVKCPTTPQMRCPDVSVHKVPQMQGVGRAGVLFVLQVPDNPAVALPRWSASAGCGRCKASGAPTYFSYFKCPTTPADAVPCWSAFARCRRCKASGAPAYFCTSSARQPSRCPPPLVSIRRVRQMQGVGRADVLFVLQAPDNAADAVPCGR